VSDHSDDEFAGNKKLGALYHAGSTAQPPAHIDQAILARARRSVRSTPQRSRPSWSVPVSMAAVLVLSISLISLIHKEAPTVSNIPADAPRTITHTKETALTDNSVSEEQKNETIAEREIPVQNSAITARQKIQQSPRKEKYVSSTSPAPAAKTIDTPQDNSDTKQKTEQEPTSGTLMETRDEMTPELFQRSIPQSETRSPASGFPGKTGANTEFGTGLKKDRYADNNQQCELLSHNACLDSKECNLVINEQKAFVCRRSMNHCDTGFGQRSDTKESCEIKNGCVYVSEPCLCPPDVVCACDENQLPQCQLRKETGD